MAITDYFTGNYDVYRHADGADAWGGSNSYANALNGSIIGIIQPLSGRKDNALTINGRRSTHKLYCDVAMDIQINDIVDDGSHRYSVLFIADAAGRNNHYEIDLELLQ